MTGFSGSDDGAIAIVFGLSATLLFVMMGVAVDYSRTANIQTAIQNDLDTAILGAAAQAPDMESIEVLAQKYFATNWKQKYQVGTVTVTVSPVVERRFTATARTTLPTTIMKLGGFDSLEITATSEVELANQNVEVALVLDTTGSMSGTKLEALQDASKALIDKAFEKPDATDHVKIALVPFAQYVNVGMSNRHAPWMSVEADSATPTEYCRDESPVIGTSNCRMETQSSSNDGVPTTYQSEVCDYQYGPPVHVCTPYDETRTWNGCAGPRNSPLDTLDEQYGTRIPGVMNVTCGSEVMPLSNDQSQLSDNIEAMVATGETYIPTGLMWGWRTLSKAAPFEEAAGYDEQVDGAKVRKALVLMTDGVNTKSPVYPSVDPVNPSHTGSDSTQANTLTADICTNIKASGITLYTVAFDVTDLTIKDILRSCASDEGKFFDAPEPAQLQSAFADIGADLSPLRIAR
ncbi:MAG: hypothetical protein ACT4N2_14165 [Hyphomicrobium sp.]